MFWPTILLLFNEGVLHSAPLTFLFLFGGNALLYAIITSGLRRYSLCIPLLLLVLIGFSLPPSEKRLAERFPEHKRSLERLVELMDQDRQVGELTPTMLTTTDGKSYSTSEPIVLLNASRVAEYRSLLQEAGLAEVVRGGRGYFMVVHRFDMPNRIRTYLGTNDSLALFGHSFADGLVSYTGYVFCPNGYEGEQARERLPRRFDDPPAGGGNIVCKEPNPRREYRSFRYRRLDANWFYFNVFRKNGPD